VLNAADEVAVAEFLAERIPFTAIAEVIAATLDAVEPQPVSHFEDLYAADARAREVAGELTTRAAATR
jgi:1-deoxy-D-xylulose-5-phosphate reductoisomerase